MMYLFLAVVSVVMFFGSVCNCFKVGQNEGICQYDYDEAEKG